jgi:hypothetical protein
MISLPRPPGWAEVAQVAIAKGALTLTETGGAQVSVPFDDRFFA